MNTATIRKILYWTPPIGWASVLFTLSCMSFSWHKPGFANEDKVFHIGLFGMLSMLLYFALRYERGLPIVKAALLAFVITSVYGASDEFHQLFTPGRDCDVFDWLADTVAGSIAFLTILAPRPKETAANTRRKA